MKQCPHCAEEVQDAAKVCKHCGRALVSRAPGCVTAVAVLLTLVAILVAGGWIYGTLTRQPTPAEAYSLCQRYVAARLSSPGSARFPAIHEAGVTIATGGDDFVVRGFVDSQNGFGAIIRTPFVCTVQHDGDERWKLSELLMGDEARPK